ncbi:MAG: zeta toxin family protein [Oceanicaulis sp.]|nr:zeta toxin family protein [Oceanicaulis sp.]
MATQRRSAMLSRGADFVTETVFSHPSKLELVKAARERGHTVWVMHVGVDSPELSVARVAYRAGIGGHAVPEHKIRERYDRSAQLIPLAVRLADKGLVYDNSAAAQSPKLVLTFDRGRLIGVRPGPPAWIRRAYAPDLLEFEDAGRTR